MIKIYQHLELPNIFIIITMSLLLCRQYYTYVTDPRCVRVGTQCWVYGAIMVSESLLCIKNGKKLFEHTQVSNIVFWLLLQAVVSILFLWGISQYHKYYPVSNTLKKLPSAKAVTYKLQYICNIIFVTFLYLRWKMKHPEILLLSSHKSLTHMMMQVQYF